MKNFFKDFRNFLKKGNILDLAIGIIIGGAFNTIVRSLVNDIIMPIIGLFFRINASEASLVLVPAVVKTNDLGVEEVVKAEVLLRYGAFIQSFIDFLIIAFSIFIALRFITRFQEKVIKKKEETKVDKPKTKSVEELLIEIKNVIVEGNKKTE